MGCTKVVKQGSAVISAAEIGRYLGIRAEIFPYRSGESHGVLNCLNVDSEAYFLITFLKG